MTREDLIEGILDNFKKKRFRAAKAKSQKNKEVSDFLRKSHQERRRLRKADKPARIKMASKRVKKAERKRYA